MNARAARGRKKLSTRLFAAFFLLSLFAFFIAAAVIVAVSWHVYEGDAEERLIRQTEETAEMLRVAEGADAGAVGAEGAGAVGAGGVGADAGAVAASTNEMVVKLSSYALADTRITLVDADGTILYDTHADAASMANHRDREEIAAARGGEESVVFRKSETTGADTLYAAAAVNDDGVVLRLSETRTSLLYYLRSLLGPLALAALLAVALSALLARLITQKTVAPLLSADLNNPLNGAPYEEVDPLLARIDAQRNELIAQNEQLERTVNLRREFTGNVSHEMKSPLQVIGGYAELIESGVASPEDTKRFASLIRTESDSMRQLIDDVLLLSQLDENAFDEAQVVDLSAACLRAVGRLESVAAAHGAEFSVSCPDGMLARGSDALAEQIAYNLLENAIRYGGGRVSVSTSRTGDDIVLAVCDNGPGIPEEQRARVFERFYRVDPSRSRETGGTGLGLAIVKHAAQSMGGTSYVEASELGGARFVVVVPAA